MAVISIKNKTKSGSLLVGNAFYSPPIFESIATVTVGSGGTSAVTFSSIPSTYQHLQVRGIARSTGSSSMKLRVNSDTGSNYSYHQLYGDGSTIASNGYASFTTMYIGNLPVAADGANLFDGFVIDILDYANTSKNKTFRSLNGFDANGSGYIALESDAWLNTSAVTTLEFTTSVGIAQYSSFALYGIKG